MKGKSDDDMDSVVHKRVGDLGVGDSEVQFDALSACSVGDSAGLRGKVTVGKAFEGNAVFVRIEDDLVACYALVGKSADSRALATTTSVIESAQLVPYELRTVTFADEDGKILGKRTGRDYGEGVKVTSPAVTKDGFLLSGWKKDSDAKDVEIKKASNGYEISGITRDITVHAVWARTYTVTFVDGFGGKTLKTQTVEEGKSATAPSSPTKSGYDFKGWDCDFTKVDSDLTVTAAWKAKPTVSQKNAVAKAKSYLKSVGGFSYKRLYEQLQYESFSDDDAAYGVDECGADWMKQAEQSAASYMKHVGGFSRSGLIRQLEYEGFTSEQASHGADSVGL